MSAHKITTPTIQQETDDQVIAAWTTLRQQMNSFVGAMQPVAEAVKQASADIAAFHASNYEAMVEFVNQLEIHRQELEEARTRVPKPKVTHKTPRKVKRNASENK